MTVLQSAITGLDEVEVNVQVLDAVFKLVEDYFQRIQDVDPNGLYILAELTNVMPKNSSYLERVWKYVVHALNKTQDA